MAESYTSDIFLYLIIFSLKSVYLAENLCVTTSSCLCNMENDQYIDISHITGGQEYLKTSIDNVTYYFSGCSYFTLPNKTFPANVTNECIDTSLCIFDSNKNISYSTGKNVGKFEKQNGENIYSLTAKNRSGYSFPVNVVLGCTNLKINSLVAESSKPANLLLYSPRSCVMNYTRGLSGGSVFLIILFVLITVYLVGGGLVLYYLRGARGKEMIPNYEFWAGLPCLVRDGVLFLCSGCNPVVVPTAETYDRI